MRYSNAIDYLRSVNEALDHDPSSITEEDVRRIMRLHEEAKNASTEGVELVVAEISSVSAECKKSEKSFFSKEESEICAPSSDEWAPAMAEMPEEDMAPSGGSTPFEFQDAEKSCRSVAPAPSPAPFWAPPPAPKIASPSVSKSALRDWDIDSGNEDVVEELNSIEVLSATILTRLRDRYAV